MTTRPFLPGAVHFITGGVVSSLGKGLRRHRSPLCSRRAATRSESGNSITI